MLRVHVEFGVFRKNPVVVLRAYQIIRVLLSLLVLRYELSAHVGRPVIGRRGHLAPESSLELARVEHFNKGRWRTIRCKHDLLLGFLIDKGLDAFVEESLAPAYMRVKRAK